MKTLILSVLAVFILFPVQASARRISDFDINIVQRVERENYLTQVAKLYSALPGANHLQNKYQTAEHRAAALKAVSRFYALNKCMAGTNNFCNKVFRYR